MGQRKTNTVCFHLYVEPKKLNKYNKANRHTDTEEKKIVVTRGEQGKGEICEGD